jgi:phosphoribosylamine--glycine ligase
MSAVLVVGSGGREHALAWKLSQSQRVSRLVVAPGNDGMPAAWDRWELVLADGKKGFESLAKKAKKEGIDLVVIGPDNALADGIVDVLEAHGIPTMGPRAAAARIESSKAFGKELMRAAGVPTAKYWVVGNQQEANQILKSIPWQLQGQLQGKPQVGWVVKADGLALGKGVRVCDSLPEALQAVEDLFRISSQLVIEEKLFGEEISWMAFCEGENCALLEPARDYKRLLEGNMGLNTGGMGALSPVPGVPANFKERIRNAVFLPVLREMKQRGVAFQGVLYAGLMVDFSSSKFWVLEFNARWGDPEAQVLIPRFSGDLFLWCEAVANGRLAEMPPFVPFDSGAAVFVVAASAGYPDLPEVGKRIRFDSSFDSIQEAKYFFSGVRCVQDEWMTSGGRVLGALGQGLNLEQARQQAYQRLSQVSFEGMQYRADIGRSGA